MIDFDVVDLDAPIEPWQPKVGDRVRIAVSPECQARFQSFDDETGQPMDHFTGHLPQENGRIGTVVTMDPTVPMLTSADHHYVVELDSRFNLGNGYYCSYSAHAACELEPLEAQG